jgi:hypothetical protein
VGWTGEIASGAGLPPELAQRMGPPPPSHGTEHQGHLSRILLGTGIGLAVLGVGALGGAAASQSAFDHSLDRSTSEANQSRIAANHALGWTGIGVITAGAGVGLSAVIVGRW